MGGSVSFNVVETVRRNSSSVSDLLIESAVKNMLNVVFILLIAACVSHGFSPLAPQPARQSLLSRSMWAGDFSSKANPWKYVSMADPDAPPEVDPTRRDPDDPSRTAPPVRLPVIDVGGQKMDVNSRLLKDRIIMIGKGVDDEMANVVVAQLLYLANEDPTKDITMYINSPGGSISSGMAIFDTMQYVPCDVNTVCFGMAASMGAFLLGAGTKGKRKSLPNARIMIHQPLGGAQGQAADIQIQATEILYTREILNQLLADFTGKTQEQILEDCDRDYFMTPEDSVEYGIIDEVVNTKSWPRIQKPKKSRPDVMQAFGG